MDSRIPEVEKKANETESIKDNRLVPVDQDSILKMPANGSGQHELFQIPTFLHKVLGAMTMTDTRDVLFADRPLVEILGNVMSRSPDEFYSTLISLVPTE